MSITVEPDFSLRGLFRVRSFAVLFPADLVSNLGSQLARFALAVLVFDRTGSASASALTYATSFLPSALGGVVLGGLADRFPRVSVMVGIDLARAALFALMAVPGLPVGVLIGLLAVAVFLDPAFHSAQVSYLADALTAEQFRASSGLRGTADQLSQVAGLALAGAVIVVVSPSGGLLIDAATFAFSGILVLVLLREPAQGRLLPAASDTTATEFAGLWRDSRTRLHMAFTVLVGLFVLPEALAVAYGARIGVGTARTSVLLAMIPLGSAVGAALILKVPGHVRARLANWLAITCGIPLIASSLYPGWIVSCVCWLVAGVLTAYQVEVISGLVAAIPAAVRGSAIGVVSAWLVGSQGVCFAIGGLLLGEVGPGAVVACAAGLGSVTAAIVVLWTRSSDSDDVGVRAV